MGKSQVLCLRIPDEACGEDHRYGHLQRDGRDVRHADTYRNMWSDECGNVRSINSEKLSYELYDVFGMSVTGEALTIVRGVPDMNGIEAWRRLSWWY